MKNPSILSLFWGTVLFLITANFGQNSKVFMHYMPWYGDETQDWRHWERYCQSLLIEDPRPWIDDTTKNIASINYPLAGPHNSLDPGLIKSHLLYMLALKVDGMVINWYGRDSYEDQVTKLWFEQIQSWRDLYGETAVPLEIALMVDDLPYMDENLTKAEKISKLLADINFAVNQYYDPYVFSHKSQGKKIIYYFPKRHPDGTFNFSADDWAVIKAQLPSDITIVYHDDIVSEYTDDMLFDANFAWIENTYPVGDPRWGEDALTWYYNTVAAYLENPSKPNYDYRVAVAYPGFNDRGVCAWTHDVANTRYVTREANGLDVFQLTWNLVEDFNENSNHKFDIIQIATFNDWNEGSEIEPSREFGFKYMNMAMHRIWHFKNLGIPDTFDLKVGLEYYNAHIGKTSDDPEQILSDYFGNTAPIADAGQNVQVIAGESVILDGTGSIDMDNDPLDYAWTLVSSPDLNAGEILNPQSSQAELITDLAGEYKVDLVVNDGKIPSAPSSVVITALTLENKVAEVLNSTTAELTDLPLDAFKRERHQETFLRRVSRVFRQVERGNYDRAERILTRRLIRQADGCFLYGVPDRRDRITQCEGGQNIIYPLLIEALGYIQSLQ